MCSSRSERRIMDAGEEIFYGFIRKQNINPIFSIVRKSILKSEPVMVPILPIKSHNVLN